MKNCKYKWPIRIEGHEKDVLGDICLLRVSPCSYNDENKHIDSTSGTGDVVTIYVPSCDDYIPLLPLELAARKYK